MAKKKKTMLVTIGYGGKTFEKVIESVKEAGVTLLIDVRSKPFSRWMPTMNRKALEESLANDPDIKYTWMGDVLGGETPTPQFRSGMSKLRKLLEGPERICVMCAEKDPEECHRYTRIAVRLEEAGLVEVTNL